MAVMTSVTDLGLMALPVYAHSCSIKSSAAVVVYAKGGGAPRIVMFKATCSLLTASTTCVSSRTPARHPSSVVERAATRIANCFSDALSFAANCDAASTSIANSCAPRAGVMIRSALAIARRKAPATATALMAVVPRMLSMSGCMGLSQAHAAAGAPPVKLASRGSNAK
ncbi:hypothetical protein T492DRAFT_342522 [Pavlovales sp. CCMP2436]|nr:hypothetical protein T492DRAFT_342522 [Pavlovales sp. CCMP2436]